MPDVNGVWSLFKPHHVSAFKYTWHGETVTIPLPDSIPLPHKKSCSRKYFRVIFNVYM